MIRLIACLIVLVLVRDVQAKVFDVVFPGSFDELVSTNGAYRLEGKVSANDYYGFEAVLSTSEVCTVHVQRRDNVKDMCVANYSEDTIRIKSIPAGVQTLELRYNVDLMPGQTNFSVSCLSIDRDLPDKVNTIRDIVRSFPNLETLYVRLGCNDTPDACFDIGECLGGTKLCVLYLESYHPIKNLESLNRFKGMDAVTIKYNWRFPTF